MDEELQGILDDLKNLQDRITKYLEQQPQPYKYTPTPIIPSVPNTVSRCGECGLELSGVMCYYCPRSNCPAGLGGPSCVNASTEGRPLC